MLSTMQLATSCNSILIRAPFTDNIGSVRAGLILCVHMQSCVLVVCAVYDAARIDGDVGWDNNVLITGN